MPIKLEFRNCPHCGKSVRADANRCHRCQRFIASTEMPVTSSEYLNEPALPSEHGAVPHGGYDDYQDDFDYDEYVANEFEKKRPKKKWQWYVTWLLVVAMSLPIIAALVNVLRP